MLVLHLITLVHVCSQYVDVADSNLLPKTCDCYGILSGHRIQEVKSVGTLMLCWCVDTAPADFLKFILLQISEGASPVLHFVLFWLTQSLPFVSLTFIYVSLISNKFLSFLMYALSSLPNGNSLSRLSLKYSTKTELQSCWCFDQRKKGLYV